MFILLTKKNKKNLIVLKVDLIFKMTPNYYDPAKAETHIEFIGDKESFVVLETFNEILLELKAIKQI